MIELMGEILHQLIWRKWKIIFMEFHEQQVARCFFHQQHDGPIHRSEINECHLKRDTSKENFIFQPSFFKGLSRFPVSNTQQDNVRNCQVSKAESEQWKYPLIKHLDNWRYLKEVMNCYCEGTPQLKNTE